MYIARAEELEEIAGVDDVIGAEKLSDSVVAEDIADSAGVEDLVDSTEVEGIVDSAGDFADSVEAEKLIGFACVEASFEMPNDFLIFWVPFTHFAA